MSTVAEPEPELELIRYEAVCDRCRVPFIACAVPDPFDPTKPTNIRKTKCDPCVFAARENYDRKVAASAAERSQEVRRGREWEALCPRAYRLISEGGTTDLSKIRESRLVTSKRPEPATGELIEGMATPAPLKWEPVLNVVQEYSYGSNGLLFRGVSGTFKTRVMWRILRRLFDQGRRIIAYTPGEFERAFRDAAGNHRLDEWFKLLVSADCFFLDDLGKSRWSQNTVETFFDLAEKLTNVGKPLFVTTNYDRENLRLKLALEKDEAEPMLRRLLENCDCRLFKHS